MFKKLFPITIVGLFAASLALQPTTAKSHAQTETSVSEKIDVPVPIYLASQNCVAKNNLDELGDNFISRCRKSSNETEFLGEYLNKSLKYIQSARTASGNKAWKLLNDNRFKK